MKPLFSVLALVLISIAAQATHTLGGHISYVDLGNSTYRFTVTQYRDCRPPSQGGGTPAALTSDNPIYVAIFRGDGTFLDSVNVTATNSGGTIVPDPGTNSPCNNLIPENCINKLVFVFTRTLPISSSGYYLSSQRCCMSAGLENIPNGSTLGLNTMIFMPPSQLTNNSAVFNNDLSQTICANQSQTIDLSATDADGDSLSYSFCQMMQGGSQNDPLPHFTNPPPYPLLPYEPSYSILDPMGIGIGPDFDLNPRTGILNFKANKQAYFHLGICCTEWRNGVAIQTNERNALIRIVDCNIGLDLDVSIDQITPFNCPVKLSANGADDYKWEIKTPQGLNQNTIYFDNDSIQQPTVLFNQNATIKSGEFYLIVTGTNSAGCKGIDTILLTVNEEAYFFVPSAFSPNGDGLNDFLTVYPSGYEFEEIKIYNRWGNLLFQSNSLDKKWTGYYNGTFLSNDTFVWVARTKDKNGATKIFKGSVVLVR